MSLTERITELVKAAFSGLWLQTSEPDECVREISALCKKQGWRLVCWNVVDGATFPLEPQAKSSVPPGDPVAMLKGIPSFVNQDGTTLLLMHNFHRFVSNTVVMQATFNAVVAGKNSRVFIVGLAPSMELPVELQKVFVPVEHPLPDKESLREIVMELTSDEPKRRPPESEMPRILEAASGLTRYEAEGAFALSLIRGKLEPEAVWELKSGMIAKSGLATLYRGKDVNFDTLKGFDHLRGLAKQLLREDCPIPPKGFIFVGPPSGGKTSIVKAIAADNGLPLIMADLGALKGSLIGQSEANVRRLIALCESMAPCVVLLDEIEDALAGATSDHVGDSGVSKDQLATILKWRSESKSRIFLCGTCNEPEAIMRVKQGAFTRDGRFDGVVFVDLPNREMRREIWYYYCGKYNLIADPSGERCTVSGFGEINSDGWSPGNIEVCCQRAVQYGITLPEAARYIRPTEPDKVDALRSWASCRCLSAYEPGLYQKGQGADARSIPKGRRTIAQA